MTTKNHSARVWEQQCVSFKTARITIGSVPLLLHKRVLITRARHQASELAAQLESLGAVCLLVPTIEIIPPPSFQDLDQAIRQVNTFDWLLFTSVNAVEVFVERLNSVALASSGSAAGRLLPRIAAIGPATARAIRSAGFEVALMPREYVAEALSAALTPYAPGARMLYLRAADARDHLHEALTAAGARVSSVVAYRSRIPPASVSDLMHLFSTAYSYPDAITFTSASTVRNLVSLLKSAALELPAGVLIASIGPITSQALREAGLQPGVEAAEATIGALIEAIAKGFERS